MSDAPLVGASPTMLEFGGNQYELHPLTLRDWGELERLALQACKRNLIESYTKNIGDLDDAQKQTAIDNAFREATKIDLDSMPSKKLKDGTDVDYPIWWASATFDGLLSTVWLSVRRGRSDLTIDQMNEITGQWSLGEAQQAADAVGDLSIPQVGNSESPRETETASEG